MVLNLALGGLLLLFNAGSTVCNQMAIRDAGGQMAWSPAIAASTTEALKLGVALCFLARSLLVAERGRSSGKSSAVIMPTDFAFCARYAVPGLLYALCNVLNYTAVEYLGSTNYQLLNNVKIITTAVVYRAALRRRLKVYQWLALVLLFFAMCTLGLSTGSTGSTGSAGRSCNGQRKGQSGSSCCLQRCINLRPPKSNCLSNFEVRNEALHPPSVKLTWSDPEVIADLRFS